MARFKAEAPKMFKRNTYRTIAIATALGILGALSACKSNPTTAAEIEPQRYEYAETREIVKSVNDAAALIETEGEPAFEKLRIPESRWRHEETYIFVLDLEGNMLVHVDPAMEGTNQLHLNDAEGRPIVVGLLAAAMELPDKPQGWYHYLWPVPGGLLPRWKSSYVRLVEAPSGKQFVVGSGMYNDRMERAFVVDMVKDAVGRIERDGKASFSLLRAKTGPFIAKDAYVFVIDPNGIELVNPAFPSLEGRKIRDVQDARGTYFVREMLELVKTRGSGWVNYMWPKPGESVSTQKSAYVTRARLGEEWVLVGSGVYLADAPKAAPDKEKLRASELMALVRESASLFAQRGDQAYTEFRQKGSKWFRDETYLFVWTMDGKRVFHAANPSIEGKDVRAETDVLGRPYGKMFLDVAAGPRGEGWVHYMYPEPGGLLPTWKSTFVKRVNSPSGKPHLIGAGIYNMEMDREFIEDVVDRAAALVAVRGKHAFEALRDKKGPFVFMDVYVFVTTPAGIELVNAGQPSLEGRNIIEAKDIKGKPLVREYIDAALKQGRAWVEYYWYKPGDNTAVRKQSYVRNVQHGNETYIVGSGLYIEK